MRKEFRGSSWRMADAFWRQIEPLLPKYAKSRRGGRPRANLRQVMNGIFYVLRTGFDNRLDVFRAEWDIYGPFQEWPAVLPLAELSDAVYQDDYQDFRKFGLDSIVKVESPFHSHFAYIAHGEDVAVIVFRGTDEEEDWLSNANIYPRSMPEGSLHAGFAAAYGTLRTEILDQLEQIGPKHIWITGHSLGGANALVCAYDLVRNEHIAIDGVLTFGQPRIGDEQFISFLQDKLGELHVHFVNEDQYCPAKVLRTSFKCCCS